jgi:hypothetical protein
MISRTGLLEVPVRLISGLTIYGANIWKPIAIAYKRWLGNLVCLLVSILIFYTLIVGLTTQRKLKPSLKVGIKPTSIGGTMDWIEKYKVVRRLTLLWACGLITYGTLEYFKDGGDSTGYIALVGILTTVIGFYMKRRYDEDAESK